LRKLAKFENFLFRARWLRLFALGLIAGYLATLFVSPHPWFIGVAGRPVFRDFVWMWSGGYDVLHGKAASVYDYADFSTVQNQVLRTDPGPFPFAHWVYPPTALFLFAPLALLPYPVAFLLWVGVTLALYVWSVWLIVPRWIALLLALTPFSVWINILLGQNGLLNAALMAFAVLGIATRPVLAGLCFGILSYKPQLSLIYPIVLAATRHWRVLAVSMLSAVVLACAAGLAFGTSAWTGFFHEIANQTQFAALVPAHELPMQQQSLYGLADFLGAPGGVAWAAHAIAAVLIAAAVIVLWRRPIPFQLKAAALVLGSFAATPYLLFWDLALLTIPAALLINQGRVQGFLAGERSLIAACWGLECFPGRPVGPIILALLGLLIWRRASVSTAADRNLLLRPTGTVMVPDV
jgi:hypothetical protein